MEELSFHLSSTFLPSSVTDFLNHLRSAPSAAARAAAIDEFVRRLEAELAKIDAFNRELPICIILLRDVISFLKKESNRNLEITLRMNEPVLEESVPLQKCEDVAEKSKVGEEEPDNLAEKKEWMSSAKLWNPGDESSLPKPDLDPQVKNNTSEPKNKGKGFLEIKDWSDQSGNAGGGMGFKPFNRTFPSLEQKNKGKGVLEIKNWSGKTGDLGCGVGLMPIKRCFEYSSSMKEAINMELMRKKRIEEDLIDALSSATAAVIATQASSESLVSSFEYGPVSNERQQGSRKQRRCWPPELHNTFLRALAKLGGEKVATPKQIREAMKVDGLTTDEVKSHLQKYRIHTRKMLASQGNEPFNSGNLWYPNYESGESSKRSPEGPLHLVLNSGVTTSITGGESMEEDDEKSPLSRNNRH